MCLRARKIKREVTKLKKHTEINDKLILGMKTKLQETQWVMPYQK